MTWRKCTKTGLSLGVTNKVVSPAPMQDNEHYAFWCMCVCACVCVYRHTHKHIYHTDWYTCMCLSIFHIIEWVCTRWNMPGPHSSRDRLKQGHSPIQTLYEGWFYLSAMISDANACIDSERITWKLVIKISSLHSQQFSFSRPGMDFHKVPPIWFWHSGRFGPSVTTLHWLFCISFTTINAWQRTMLFSALKHRINCLQVNKQRYYKERCDFCFVFLNIISPLIKKFSLRGKKDKSWGNTSQNEEHELLVI